jgi:porphobilinogen synthase
VQVALRNLRDEVRRLARLMAADCLDEFTGPRHCGVLTDSGEVDNDATLERYASIAVAQADAGADVIAPSGMMDGPGRRIRRRARPERPRRHRHPGLRREVRLRVLRPFRDAAECAPQFGDRRGYQMDPPTRGEALDETALDIAEGADMVMVKPALRTSTCSAPCATRSTSPSRRTT